MSANESQFAQVSRRVSDNSQFILATAEPGDILEFQRDSETQCGLYLGDGKVMCFDLTSDQSSEALIQQHTLEEVCEEGNASIQNHDDVAHEEFRLKARKPEEIIKTAMFYKDLVVTFEFNFRNSEYYCTLWRYGKGFSTLVAQKTSKQTSFFGKGAYAKYK